VFKKSIDNEDDISCGLSALRANVGLGYGLKLTIDKAPTPVIPDGTKVDYTYATPDYYAAFIPDETGQDVSRVGRQVWAMSHESGSKPYPFEVPNYQDRIARYMAAVSAVGLDPLHDMRYDDYKLDNLVLNGSPDSPAGRLIKLDVMAAEDFAVKYGI
jgi:hypothetical protein